MLDSQKLNEKIKHVHARALRIFYKILLDIGHLSRTFINIFN